MHKTIRWVLTAGLAAGCAVALPADAPPPRDAGMAGVAAPAVPEAVTPAPAPHEAEAEGDALPVGVRPEPEPTPVFSPVPEASDQPDEPVSTPAPSTNPTPASPAPADPTPVPPGSQGPGDPAKFSRLPRVTGATNPYRLVIDKSANMLYLYRDGILVAETQVATGKSPDLTPEGHFTIVQKEVNPGWTDPDTGKFVPGGAPDNPLQSRWLGLSVPGTNGWVYGIHGTLYPESMGKHASLGCVRMLNAEIEALFDLVPRGTPVTIVPKLADKTRPPALP